jgi:transglutaminase-like putative cysteine protease
VDLLSNTAASLFGHLPQGWERVQAVCDWVHSNVKFSYPRASPTRTALDVYREGIGVCRDFQHLAITFCRALNIPARYATGYLGDIGVPPAPSPMDFSAWFEVYLEDRWWTFDARHNAPRIGRVLIGTGMDATDVAITTSFGSAMLSNFEVVTYEIG